MNALRPQCEFFCLLVHEAADNDRFYTSNVCRSAKPNSFGPVEREASKASLPRVKLKIQKVPEITKIIIQIYFDMSNFPNN